MCVMKNIMSIDVEDWYHILELRQTPNLREGVFAESRVEFNFLKLLDLLDENGSKATCFFLGQIAERHPKIVKEAANRKHEISSHGYAHQMVHTHTRTSFYEDVRKAKKILEDVSGESVVGYRAPGFSIVPETAWAFEQLLKAGYKYDSSLFPTKRECGYFQDTKLGPYKMENMEFYEFPVTVVNFGGLPKTCFFGGGYLRLFPYFLIKVMIEKVERENRPVVFYVHPREIDPDHPRLEMSLKRRFKSYVNLRTTERKLRRIILNNSTVSIAEFLLQYDCYFA